MTGTLAQESSLLLVELHGALSELDRSRKTRFEELTARIDALRAQLATLAEDHDGSLAVRIDGLVGELECTPEEARRREWLAFRARVQPHYEAIVHDLRAERVDVPSLRPTNYVRNALHLSSSMLGLAVIELGRSWLLTVLVSGAFFVSGWALELARKRSERVNAFCMRLFGKTAHPHEAHRINSATWYATALFAIALTGNVPAAAIGLLVLGLGDPAAAIVGRRFGKTKLLHGRTLEGTFAFVGVASLASFAFLAAVHPGLGLVRLLLAALVGATAGAIAELTSRRLDDNLTIPLAAFVAGAAVLAL